MQVHSLFSLKQFVVLTCFYNNYRVNSYTYQIKVKVLLQLNVTAVIVDSHENT